jgi:hypothetical protein
MGALQPDLRTTSLKILLDIDDTALISHDQGKSWTEHPRLNELISSYDVYLYSGNPDIETYSRRWKTKGYIPKGSNYRPQADVLIDNNYKLHRGDVDVEKCYSSIDSFFKHTKSKKK